MAPWKPLVFILVVILIGVAAFFYFTKPSGTPSSTTPSTTTGFGQPAQNIPPPNEISSPDAFAIGFYTWYLQGIKNDPGFVFSDQYKSAINNWLAPSFIANWNTIVENTDTNPVLLAQDYADSWLTNINASVVTQTPTTATVLVSLGVAQELNRLKIELIRTGGTWRIASVAPAS